MDELDILREATAPVATAQPTASVQPVAGGGDLDAPKQSADTSAQTNIFAPTDRSAAGALREAPEAKSTSITSTESAATTLDTEQPSSPPLGVDEEGEMEYTETEVLTRDFLNQDESTGVPLEEKAGAEKKTQESPSVWPKQMHHFASNKNKKYTPQFEKITSKYGLKLDEPWNKEKMHHLGRHPNEYHEWILESLKFADSIANGDVDLFKDEFEKAKQRIRDNPILLRKKGWK